MTANQPEPEDLVRAARADAEATGVDRKAPNPELSGSRSAPGERSGDVIDRYQLVREIGEGGMGTVWLARQSEPVTRDVALKIIKLGMDTKEVVARFEAERQALAMMDHPHIAKVLDGGATEGGRPYFVMEFVEGVPITEYCDKQKLELHARLMLFAQVCEGIQHAHQKGIIHRDIKPGNVLVAPQDGHPAPKVIDFGIAKATNAELTQSTMATQVGQILGTPEYMAPEQLGTSDLDIDTRADVYSLGVLLYELLTGTKPFDLRTVIEAGYDELLRTIREVEPDKPSTRITKVGDGATTIAASRQVDAKTLGKGLGGDLDWIVMKALEKDRTRRYETANGFAADIRRYLDQEPVIAAPPSAAYRLRKLIRRRKKTVAVVVTIAFLLIAGSIGTGIGLWKALQANRALDVALGERKKAEGEARAEAERATRAEAATKARAAELEQVAAFQSAQLGQLDVSQMGVRMRTAILEAAGDERREPVDEALAGLNFTNLAMRTLEENLFARTIESIDGQFTDQPLVQAQLLQSMAEALRELGLLTTAEDPQQRALEIRRTQLGADHLDTIESLFLQGVLKAAVGDRSAARACFDESIERRQRLLPDEDPKTLNMRAHLGNLFIEDGRAAEAETIHRELLAIQRQTLGPQHSQTLSAIGNVAESLEAQGRYPEAEPFYREALTLTRQSFGDLHVKTLVAINNLGAVLHSQGKLEEAEEYRRQALDGARQVLGDRHPKTLTFVGNLGYLLDERGQLTEAETLLREALEGQLRSLPPNHPSTLGVMANLGLVLSHQRRPDEAEVYMRRALEGQRSTLGDEHPDTLGSLNNLGMHLRMSGRPADAEPLYRAALEGHRKVFGEDHPNTMVSYSNMGSVLAAQGRPGDAVPYCEAGLGGALRLLGAEHPTTLAMLFNMGYLLNAQGELVDAAGCFHDAYVAQRQLLGEGHTSTQTSRGALTGVLGRMVDQARAAGDETELGVALGRAGEFWLTLGDAERAARELGEALERLPSGDALHARQRARIRAALGAALATLGDFVQAEHLLLESADWLVENPASNEPRTSLLGHGATEATLGYLITVYGAWHEADPAGGHEASASEWASVLEEWRAESGE